MGHSKTRNIFDFEIVGPLYRVTTVKGNQGTLEFRTPDSSGVISPSDHAWFSFWQKVEKLNIWDWNNRIDGPGISLNNGKFINGAVLDGVSWRLGVERESKKINCSASNAYPDVRGHRPGKTFRSFLGAIEELTNVNLFTDVGTRNPTKPERIADFDLFDAFIPVFRYRVHQAEPVDQEVLNKEMWNAEGVVYALRANGTILYIGSTRGRLRTRIKDHLRRMPKYTREKDRSYRAAVEGLTVTIYAHQPPNLDYMGLSVPMFVGLEHSLIDRLRPQFVARR